MARKKSRQTRRKTRKTARRSRSTKRKSSRGRKPRCPKVIKRECKTDSTGQHCRVKAGGYTSGYMPAGEAQRLAISMKQSAAKNCPLTFQTKLAGFRR